jgi:hypothetical protein
MITTLEKIMNSHKKRLFRTLLTLFISVIVILGAHDTAKADGIITDGQVPAGQTVENDAIAFSDKVTIDGNVNGDLIAFAGEVVINGDVTGSVLTIGRDITINGNVGGSVYSLGVNLDLGSASAINRNLYYGGIRLITDDGSSVERDMVVASLTAQLAGQPGRDLKAMIGLLQFIDIIREGVEDELESQDIPLPSPDSEENDNQGTGIETNQPKLVFISYTPGYHAESISPHLSPNDKSPSPIAQIDTSRIQNEQLVEWVVDRVEAFLTYLIVGLIFMWVFPKYFNNWANKIRTSPLSVSGYGFLALIIALNGFIVFLVIAVLILVIGLGLGYLTLWQLAIYFWGIGFSGLVLAFSIYALFVFYVSKTIVAYMVGLLIIERFTQDPMKHKALVFALGLMLYVLLAAIPYFGWVVGIIATILGVGAVLLAFRESREILPIREGGTE